MRFIHIMRGLEKENKWCTNIFNYVLHKYNNRNNNDNIV